MISSEPESPPSRPLSLPLSVVVPTLDEERGVALLLNDLDSIRTPHEVCIVDGGSGDATTAVAFRFGARVIGAKRGRGKQLAVGARAAHGRWLLFLHADVRLSAQAASLVDRVIAADTGNGSATAASHPAYTFRLRIDAEGVKYRLVEWGTNLRSRLLALPHGYQGLLMHRLTYEAAGGFPDWPTMEDVAIAHALRPVTQIHLLEDSLLVSSRGWDREGVVRRTFRNWALLTAYLRGQRPEPQVRRRR